MLTIRLIRTGKKNAPSFRVVLIEKTAPPKSGKFLEILGNYNPRLKELNLKKERIQYWLSQGVKTSETVHNLLVKQGIIEAPKIKKRFKKKKKEETAVEKEKSKPTEEKTAGVEKQKKQEADIDKSEEKSKIKEE